MATEHDGLMNIMQTCVDYGAKYGKFLQKTAKFCHLDGINK